MHFSTFCWISRAKWRLIGSEDSSRRINDLSIQLRTFISLANNFFTYSAHSLLKMSSEKRKKYAEEPPNDAEPPKYSPSSPAPQEPNEMPLGPNNVMYPDIGAQRMIYQVQPGASMYPVATIQPQLMWIFAPLVLTHSPQGNKFLRYLCRLPGLPRWNSNFRSWCPEENSLTRSATVLVTCPNAVFSFGVLASMNADCLKKRAMTFVEWHTEELFLYERKSGSREESR